MISQSHIPAEFLCPITTELMEDPVILEDGRSYERSAITKWLTSSQRSPMTGAALEHKHVLPNVNLKALIEDWKDAQTVEAAVREEETALTELPRNQLAAFRAQLEGAFQQEDGITLVVERVQLVYNHELETRFQRKCAELGQLRGENGRRVVTRYHGTTKVAAASIAQQGFRLPTPDEDGDFCGKGLRVYYTEEQREAAAEHMGDMLMYGQALYVSTDLEKATRFAQGAVILCQCAPGIEMTSRQAQHGLTWAELQRQGYDSVRALAGCQESGGCRFEEHALYHEDQVLPTHVVHFRLVKTGGASIVAQPLSVESRIQAHDHSLDSLLKQLAPDTSVSAGDVDERRIQACKTLGDIARDDQHKAISKFLNDRRLIAQLASCARSPNEALQFEALRAWWNFSFNDQNAQDLTMQHLGVALLSSLLASPNSSLRLRATGLIWNLTQHSKNSRQVFVEAGALAELGVALELVMKEVTSSASPPWGVAQLLFGTLANIVVTCGDDVRQHSRIVWAGELMIGMNLITPPAVQQQATRFVCNLISEGKVDSEWQKQGFSYRTSAPREALEIGAAAA
jgi:hypothetical protein